MINFCLCTAPHWAEAAYQVTVLLVLYFDDKNISHLGHESDEHGNRVKDTVIVNALVLCQIFNKFNARKPDEVSIFRGLGGNCMFIGIVAITVIVQDIVVEFLGKFARTVQLSWQLWLVSVSIGFISWPLALLGKLIPVTRTPVNELFSRRF